MGGTNAQIWIKKNGFALSSLLVQLKQGLGLDHQMLTRLPGCLITKRKWNLTH